MFHLFRRAFCALIVAFALTVACAANAQNLLVNSSFESPSAPPNSASVTTPASWIASGAYLRMLNGNYGGSSSNYPLPQEGQQYVGLGNSSSVSQAVTVNSAGNYSLAWFDTTGYDGPSGYSPYSVLVTDSHGNTVKSANFDAYPSGLRVWAPRSLTFTLVPDTYTVRFEGHVAVFGGISMLDNIRFQLVSAPALITGKLQFNGIVAYAPSQNVTLVFRPADGSADITQNISVPASGDFQASVPRRNYLLHVKGSKYLAANVSVNAAGGDVSGLLVKLRAGDADNDNVVDIADFGALVNVYNDTYDVTNPNANPNDIAADFNGDGVIDIADFGLLVANYNLNGDL